MPMFLQDHNDPNKLVFFYQGSGVQLGAEGFTVGLLLALISRKNLQPSPVICLRINLSQDRFNI
ncbi:hypothetical protein YC2023_106490 [Brassica napus]